MDRVSLVGCVFARLTVIAPAEKVGRDPGWLCRCACGKEVLSTRHRLTSGNTRSCGCWKREIIGRRRRTHGATAGGKTAEYRTWKDMLRRCRGSKRADFKYYGGRGITVCEKWAKSFPAFLSDVGVRPSEEHSLDRFPDKNGPYAPGNVRWATRAQQMRNTRANRLIEHDGRTQTMSDWADETGLKSHVIGKRLQRGWPVALSLTLPLGSRLQHAHPDDL